MDVAWMFGLDELPVAQGWDTFTDHERHAIPTYRCYLSEYCGSIQEALYTHHRNFYSEIFTEGRIASKPIPNK